MKTYRLITYNIHKGVAALRKMSVMDRLVLSLKESDADFLLLQEFVGERRLSSEKVERHLEALADARWPHSAYGKNAVFPTRNHGNAILSAAKIRKSHNLNLTIHHRERRGLLHSEVVVGSQVLHLCTAHLDLLELTRREQLAKIVRYIKKHVPADAPFILGGDFNDWAQKVGPLFLEELGCEEFLAPSFPSWAPLLALDRLYVRNVKVKSFAALKGKPWNRLSDHLPLHLEFQLPHVR